MVPRCRTEPSGPGEWTRETDVGGEAIFQNPVGGARETEPIQTKSVQCTESTGRGGRNTPRCGKRGTIDGQPYGCRLAKTNETGTMRSKRQPGISHDHRRHGSRNAMGTT